MAVYHYYINVAGNPYIYILYTVARCNRLPEGISIPLLSLPL